jgi:DNA-binding CsgD family transcriptional regulator
VTDNQVVAGEVEQLVELLVSGWGLSPRQLKLVKLSVAGLHRKETASRLACSLKTIEGYWKRIYEKTGCDSEAAVVARFIREAFTSADVKNAGPVVRPTA